jgi:hypothetical protein
LKEGPDSIVLSATSVGAAENELLWLLLPPPAVVVVTELLALVLLFTELLTSV